MEEQNTGTPVTDDQASADALAAQQAAGDATLDAIAEAQDVVTVEEAKAMFAERKDLARVLTDKGWLTRDGALG